MEKWYSVRKELKPGKEILVDNFGLLDNAKICCDKHPGTYVLELTEDRIYSNPE